MVLSLNIYYIKYSYRLNYKHRGSSIVLTFDNKTIGNTNGGFVATSTGC